NSSMQIISYWPRSSLFVANISATRLFFYYTISMRKSQALAWLFRQTERHRAKAMPFLAY
ncbi:MAG: hypothetical protein IJ496_09875, partial [Ruminococcus sp.]|nr:hypothetical protein [Ruminococcus sp.]